MSNMIPVYDCGLESLDTFRGYFDPEEAELIGENELSELYRTPDGDYITRSWDLQYWIDFRDKWYKTAILLSYKEAVEWMISNGIRPPADVMKAAGLRDFTGNNGSPATEDPPPTTGQELARSSFHLKSLATGESSQPKSEKPMLDFSHLTRLLSHQVATYEQLTTTFDSVLDCMGRPEFFGGEQNTEDLAALIRELWVALKKVGADKCPWQWEIATASEGDARSLVQMGETAVSPWIQQLLGMACKHDVARWRRVQRHMAEFAEAVLVGVKPIGISADEAIGATEKNEEQLTVNTDNAAQLPDWTGEIFSKYRHRLFKLLWEKREVSIEEAFKGVYGNKKPFNREKIDGIMKNTREILDREKKPYSIRARRNEVYILEFFETQMPEQTNNH